MEAWWEEHTGHNDDTEHSCSKAVGKLCHPLQNVTLPDVATIQSLLEVYVMDTVPPEKVKRPVVLGRGTSNPMAGLVDVESKSMGSYTDVLKDVAAQVCDHFGTSVVESARCVGSVEDVRDGIAHAVRWSMAVRWEEEQPPSSTFDSCQVVGGQRITAIQGTQMICEVDGVLHEVLQNFHWESCDDLVPHEKSPDLDNNDDMETSSRFQVPHVACPVCREVTRQDEWKKLFIIGECAVCMKSEMMYVSPCSHGICQQCFPMLKSVPLQGHHTPESTPSIFKPQCCAEKLNTNLHDYNKQLPSALCQQDDSGGIEKVRVNSVEEVDFSLLHTEVDLALRTAIKKNPQIFYDEETSWHVMGFVGSVVQLSAEALTLQLPLDQSPLDDDNVSLEDVSPSHTNDVTMETQIALSDSVFWGCIRFRSCRGLDADGILPSNQMDTSATTVHMHDGPLSFLGQGCMGARFGDSAEWNTLSSSAGAIRSCTVPDLQRLERRPRQATRIERMELL